MGIKRVRCPRCKRLFAIRVDGQPYRHRVKGGHWCGNPETTQRYPHGHPYHEHRNI